MPFSKTKLLEVRCCCIPQKLLGWLEVANDCHEVIMYERPHLFDASERYRDDPNGMISMHTPQRIVLPIDWIINEGEKYRAIKAEGVELDVLREIPGFIENRSTPPGASKTGTQPQRKEVKTMQPNVKIPDQINGQKVNHFAVSVHPQDWSLGDLWPHGTKGTIAAVIVTTPQGTGTPLTGENAVQNAWLPNMLTFGPDLAAGGDRNIMEYAFLNEGDDPEKLQWHEGGTVTPGHVFKDGDVTLIRIVNKTPNHPPVKTATKVRVQHGS